MVTLAIFALCAGVFIISYLIFFFTGGCFCLVRTALNEKLSAPNKLYWMLAQTYAPLSSLAYLLLIEKKREFQLLGVLCVLTSSCASIYFLSIVHWDKLGAIGPRIVKLYASGVREVDQEKRIHEERKENHKKEAALTQKAKDLVIRLKTIQKISAITDPTNSNQFIISLLVRDAFKYGSGAISEGDYERLLNTLDAYTAANTLSPTDAKNWIIFHERIVTEAAKGTVNSRLLVPLASPELTTPGMEANENNPFADQVAALSDRLSKGYQNANSLDDKERMRVSLTALQVLTRRYEEGATSQRDYENFLKDLDGRTATGTFSSQNYVLFLPYLRSLMTIPCPSCGEKYLESTPNE